MNNYYLTVTLESSSVDRLKNFLKLVINTSKNTTLVSNAKRLLKDIFNE